MDHRTRAELLAGLDHVKASPSDHGSLQLIVRRPGVDEREVLDAATLSLEDGLVGDGWRRRGSGHTPDGSAEVDRQLTVMNARAIGLIAGDRDRWALAGDQLYVDLDLSGENLPAGTRLRFGDAVIEVSEPPHTGCSKFSGRFGVEALRLVNSDEGRRLRLRGMNARVVEPGTIRAGDVVSKLVPATR
jgi:MOSC domain-containing protein YiiM